MAGAPPSREPQLVLRDLCRRLVRHGMPLYRVGVFVRTLHPNVLGRGFIWHQPSDTVEVNEAPYDFLQSEQYLRSPIHTVFNQHVEVRRRLADPACPIDYPIIEDLAKEGGTDFLALPLRFINGEVHAASFATRRPGGFSEAEIAGLREIALPLTRIAEIFGYLRKSRDILHAYLGRQAGEKVLEGQIRRGDGQEIRAVLWFCDLRDSTRLADSMSRAEFLVILNEFFECVLQPVLDAGGEVLRFIGDAALAIFPVGADAGPACRTAVAAAREAMARMQAANARRSRPLEFGIGLHLGDVLYGNIGTPTRIEFTVIGAAANEAARIESLCKVLGVPLVLSHLVAEHVPDCRALGAHRLRGVGAPIELFTLGLQNTRP